MIPRARHAGPARGEELLSRRQVGPIGRAISPRHLADIWGVNVQTIYRDIRKGALRAHRLPGGDLRILLTDARRYGKPIE